MLMAMQAWGDEPPDIFPGNSTQQSGLLRIDEASP